jgi:hypothetical protein
LCQAVARRTIDAQATVSTASAMDNPHLAHLTTTTTTRTWRAMAKKKAAVSPGRNDIIVDRAHAASPTRLTVDTKGTEPTSFPPLEGRTLPTVHVNNANLSELKNACDDVVKKVCVCVCEREREREREMK